MAIADARKIGESIPAHRWMLTEETADYRRYRAYIDSERTLYVEKTEYLADELLQKANTQEFNDSDGKRWGDGRVVARVPLNVLFNPANQIRDKLKEGDHEHMKWWLNSERARPFRTFRGRV